SAPSARSGAPCRRNSAPPPPSLASSPSDRPRPPQPSAPAIARLRLQQPLSTRAPTRTAPLVLSSSASAYSASTLWRRKSFTVPSPESRVPTLIRPRPLHFVDHHHICCRPHRFQLQSQLLLHRGKDRWRSAAIHRRLRFVRRPLQLKIVSPRQSCLVHHRPVHEEIEHHRQFAHLHVLRVHCHLDAVPIVVFTWDPIRIAGARRHLRAALRH